MKRKPNDRDKAGFGYWFDGLTGLRLVSETLSMEIHLTLEQETQLGQLAVQAGRGVDNLAQEAIQLYREEDARFLEIVQAGDAELDRGEFVTHEEVGARLERLFQA